MLTETMTHAEVYRELKKEIKRLEFNGTLDRAPIKPEPQSPEEKQSWWQRLIVRTKNF